MRVKWHMEQRRRACFSGVFRMLQVNVVRSPSTDLAFVIIPPPSVDGGGGW